MTTCPHCGKQLTPKRKPGPKAKRPNPPLTSIPQRLRERYDAGLPFSVEEAAEHLGESMAVVASNLRRMEDAIRVGTVRAKSGQRVGLWGIVLAP